MSATPAISRRLPAPKIYLKTIHHLVALYHPQRLVVCDGRVDMRRDDTHPIAGSNNGFGLERRVLVGAEPDLGTCDRWVAVIHPERLESAVRDREDSALRNRHYACEPEQSLFEGQTQFRVGRIHQHVRTGLDLRRDLVAVERPCAPGRNDISTDRAVGLLQKRHRIRTSLLATLCFGDTHNVTLVTHHTSHRQSGSMSTLVTNVPGPQVPLYMLGAKLEAMYPQVPLLEDMGLGIALMSYDGKLCWGFNADYEMVPDLKEFAVRIRSSFEQLQTAVGIRSVEDVKAEKAAAPAEDAVTLTGSLTA